MNNFNENPFLGNLSYCKNKLLNKVCLKKNENLITIISFFSYTNKIYLDSHHNQLKKLKEQFPGLSSTMLVFLVRCHKMRFQPFSHDFNAISLAACKLR